MPFECLHENKICNIYEILHEVEIIQEDSKIKQPLNHKNLSNNKLFFVDYHSSLEKSESKTIEFEKGHDHHHIKKMTCSSPIMARAWYIPLSKDKNSSLLLSKLNLKPSPWVEHSSSDHQHQHQHHSSMKKNDPFLSHTKQDNPFFYGYCYYCDCPRHSQNYCPLRQCFNCHDYGHSSKVCPKNTASGNKNWRTNTFKTYGNSTKYWKKSPSLYPALTVMNHNIKAKFVLQPVQKNNLDNTKGFEHDHHHEHHHDHHHEHHHEHLSLLPSDDNYRNSKNNLGFPKKSYSFGSTWKETNRYKNIDKNWRSYDSSRELNTNFMSSSDERTRWGREESSLPSLLSSPSSSLPSSSLPSSSSSLPASFPAPLLSHAINYPNAGNGTYDSNIKPFKTQFPIEIILDVR